MKKIVSTAVLAATLVAIAATPRAQTVTVSKTLAADYSTVQDAINSFSSDTDLATPNVINILDSEVYDEAISVSVPCTIHGDNATSRPILALESGSGGVGMLIQIADGASNSVNLENLVCIPSLLSTPSTQGILSKGNNLQINMKNVVVTANDGTNYPVTLTGLTTGTIDSATYFGDDLAWLGSDGSGPGSGTDAVLEGCVFSYSNPADDTAGSHDNLICSGAGNSYTVKDGCVFSFSSRFGIQVNKNFKIDAPLRLWL